MCLFSVWLFSSHKLNCQEVFESEKFWGTFCFPGAFVIVSTPPAPLSEPVFRWLADTDTSGYSDNTIYSGNTIQYNTNTYKNVYYTLIWADSLPYIAVYADIDVSIYNQRRQDDTFVHWYMSIVWWRLPPQQYSFNVISKTLLTESQSGLD